jgi:hypothetical protein
MIMAYIAKKGEKEKEAIEGAQSKGPPKRRP